MAAPACTACRWHEPAPLSLGGDLDRCTNPRTLHLYCCTQRLL